ncbi:MAG: ribosome maturation factor RimM [Pseudomonadota bacterium]
MTEPSDLIVIAAIAGAHGVRGEAKVKAFGDPLALCEYGPLLDQDGAVIATPVSTRAQGDFAVVGFEESFTREQIQSLKGTLLHVPRSALPEPDEDEYYHADLIGLRAETPDGVLLGRVRAVHDFGAGDVLEIEGSEEPILAPFTKATVLAVEIEKGRLILIPPMPAEEADAQ